MQRVQLSKDFALDEFLRSPTAERHQELMALQYSPPSEVIDNLTYLAEHVLQPLRDIVRCPIHVTSGYRSRDLNQIVGGSATSQHCVGEAADCILDARFLEEESTLSLRKVLEIEVGEIIGNQVLVPQDANFYLFALLCLHLEHFDVDQVIHEYGTYFGHPAWVHVASSRRQDRRQILIIGSYTNRNYIRPDKREALILCTQRVEQ